MCVSVSPITHRSLRVGPSPVEEGHETGPRHLDSRLLRGRSSGRLIVDGRRTTWTSGLKGGLSVSVPDRGPSHVPLGPHAPCEWVCERTNRVGNTVHPAPERPKDFLGPWDTKERGRPKVRDPGSPCRHPLVTYSSIHDGHTNARLRNWRDLVKGVDIV